MDNYYIITLIIFFLILLCLLLLIKYNPKMIEQKLNFNIKLTKKKEAPKINPKLIPPPKKYCKDYCRNYVCKLYENQYNNYESCKMCSDKNMCYNHVLESCVNCENGKNNCEELYGCHNGPPMNPKYTDCIKCWK